MDQPFLIRHISADRLDDLEPLWKALHSHHLAVAGHLEALSPSLSPEASWINRRAKYETWLASPDAFLLAAEADADADADHEIVGYAMARVQEQRPGSWDRAAKTGVLESLSVRADQRGGGVGTRLFEAVRAEFVKRGAREFQLDVIAGNTDAVRFYTRQGLVPYVTTLLGRS
ncbi:GNAT family N-acetyltransferase [Streptomyces sp. MZ04]|uniref:GNAT family N-acetyltransferase n=1 Tax=Streptomyces sp. MZ04 TaxID=2559236 RepID=UPI00107E7DB9|nr:GNAT family N-acetyltransferase [Streptomyces sp. MZ04]TGB00985.1 GNAT family N-acetyltransferase [Streptomyces sp. MZ04]